LVKVKPAIRKIESDEEEEIEFLILKNKKLQNVKYST